MIAAGRTQTRKNKAMKTILRDKRFWCAVVLAAVSLMVGCRDMGTGPDPSAPTLPGPPPPRPQRSFQADVRPIFADSRIGCLSCHGGTNDLFVGTQPDLLRGGLHGPAVVPGNSAASLLIQKIGPNPPFGARMPFGGTPLPDSTIQVIRDWIDQGALNN